MYMYNLYVYTCSNTKLVTSTAQILIHTYQLLGNIHIYTFTNATRD